MSLCEKVEHLGSYVNFITTFREGGNERQERHLKVIVFFLFYSFIIKHILFIPFGTLFFT